MSQKPHEWRAKLEELIAIALVLTGFALLAAIPIQAAIESLIWLRDGEWAHYSWIDYLQESTAGSLMDTEFVGLNRLFARVLNMWISVPISAAGVAYFFLISIVWK